MEIKLIVHETYFCKIGNKVEKVKLCKILDETINGNSFKVEVEKFYNSKNKEKDSWILWNDEIFPNRKQAENSKTIY